jgi:hypothetical protein
MPGHPRQLQRPDGQKQNASIALRGRPDAGIRPDRVRRRIGQPWFLGKRFPVKLRRAASPRAAGR